MTSQVVYKSFDYLAEAVAMTPAHQNEQGEHCYLLRLDAELLTMMVFALRIAARNCPVDWPQSTDLPN